MNLLYKIFILSLFIACNQLDASASKFFRDSLDLFMFTGAVAVEFIALSERDNSQNVNTTNISPKRNKLHEDVAKLDHEAIIHLIKLSYVITDTVNESLSNKNEKGETPYDQAKKGAMNRYWPPSTRKQFYAMCKIFETANNEYKEYIHAPSSIELAPQPNYETMRREYEAAMASIVILYTDINETDKYGSTKLHHAVYEINIIDVQRLISAGADPNIKNRSSFDTPFEIAKINAYRHEETLIQRKKNHAIAAYLQPLTTNSKVDTRLDPLPKDKILNQQRKNKEDTLQKKIKEIKSLESWKDTRIIPYYHTLALHNKS